MVGEQVPAYDDAVAAGWLDPVHDFIAYELARRLPSNGVLVDLGTGPANLLEHLARARPDATFYGIDLSSEMIARALARELPRNLRLLHGDMTTFPKVLSKAGVPLRDIDVVSVVNAAHHLPDVTALEQLMTALGEQRRTHGSALVIKDLVRPYSDLTRERFGDVFTPTAPKTFLEDTRNSLAAAFSRAEIKEAAKLLGRTAGSHAYLAFARFGMPYGVISVRQSKARPDRSTPPPRPRLGLRARINAMAFGVLFRRRELPRGK